MKYKLLLYAFFAFYILVAQDRSVLQNLSNVGYHDHSSDRIVRFNRDTVLVAGFFYDLSRKEDYVLNTVYLTHDNGKTWKPSHFDGDAWIYDAYDDQSGKLWMGGSDEYIHFSRDYGQTWKRKPKPFHQDERVLSVFMRDSLRGIAGGLDGSLAITYDNWRTVRTVPPPELVDSRGSGHGIEKVRITDSIILVRNRKQVYFSRIDKIAWKTFNAPIRDFEVEDSGDRVQLHGCSQRQYVVRERLLLQEAEAAEPEIPFGERFGKKRPDMNAFLDAGIAKVSIRSANGEAIASRKSGTGDMAKLSEILRTNERYLQPRVGSFSFTPEDLADFIFYRKRKEVERKELGSFGDTSLRAGLDNPNFADPVPVLEHLDQQVVEDIMRYDVNDGTLFRNSDYMIVTLSGKNGSEIRITSENAVLAGLPWTVEYGGKKTLFYDNRLTTFMRGLLAPETLYYKGLLAGELIFRLVEEHIYVTGIRWR